MMMMKYNRKDYDTDGNIDFEIFISSSWFGNLVVQLCIYREFMY